ncbi:MAG: mechanosensitive ion channel family protein [Bacteroidaceae bacterium]|nr:mechanosensitive ion channel family protein [Bacteroidaceae bacterium]
MEIVTNELIELLAEWGIDYVNVGVVQRVITFLLIALIAWGADFVCRHIVQPAVKAVVKKTHVTWDDQLLNDKVLNNICHVVPSLVVYVLLPFALYDKPLWMDLLVKISEVYIIAVSLRLVCSFIDSVYLMNSKHETLKNRPLKGIFEMAKVVTICMGVIWIFAILLEKSLWELFVGLGAAATVLMLVFKDTIVGLVSGVQLSANDMVRPGDWITMTKYGADGVVLDVTLTTVKVRNWDNTIVTVPPYTLVSDSFQNWRGMQESGGRRVKRSVSMDMTSVRFCTEEELAGYIEEGLVAPDDNTEEITNLTVFRRYLMRYLRNEPRVNTELTLMVRQLQPTAQGIPMELYFFSRSKVWTEYETLQADVFDYVLAVIPRFKLRVFQSPTGLDLKESVFTQEQE